MYYLYPKTINFLKLCLIASIFLLTTACAIKFGENFDPEAFQNWVKPGETSSKQVVEFLGPPTSKGMIVEADGSKLKRYIYYYGKGKMSNMQNAKFKMLEVRFNQDNIVNSYNWSAAQ